MKLGMDNTREAELLAIIREQQQIIERLTARIEYLEVQLNYVNKKENGQVFLSQEIIFTKGMSLEKLRGIFNTELIETFSQNQLTTYTHTVTIDKNYKVKIIFLLLKINYLK